MWRFFKPKNKPLTGNAISNMAPEESGFINPCSTRANNPPLADTGLSSARGGQALFPLQRNSLRNQGVFILGSIDACILLRTKEKIRLRTNRSFFGLFPLAAHSGTKWKNESCSRYKETSLLKEGFLFWGQLTKK